jgi:hypothetical protein
MSVTSPRRRRIAAVSACVLIASVGGEVASPAVAATIPPPLTGRVLLPDGSPLAGARVTLQAEVAQQIAGGDGTDGFLVGTAVTDATGAWSVVPLWPGPLDDAVRNPDGSITVHAEASSADGTWDKMFDLDVDEPTTAAESAIVPDPSDSDIVSGDPGGPVTGVTLSLVGVTPSIDMTPNPLAPVETDYPDGTAYDVADADDGDETGLNAGKPPKKTCDLAHHVCYLTGDPGACRTSEKLTAWRNMKGDDHTQQRWVPVQSILTTAHGHERYAVKNGQTTQMSVAYGGALGNYKGGLAFSTEDSSDIGNSASVGTWFRGYFAAQWIFRKQRQWCVGADPGHVDYNLMRDSGERRFVPEQWLGGLDEQAETIPLFACHDAYAITVHKGDKPWVARTSKTRLSGYFSLFGVALDASTKNDARHKLTLTSNDTTRFCPDSSTSIAHTDRVQEE